MSREMETLKIKCNSGAITEIKEDELTDQRIGLRQIYKSKTRKDSGDS